MSSNLDQKPSSRKQQAVCLLSFQSFGSPGLYLNIFPLLFDLKETQSFPCILCQPLNTSYLFVLTDLMSLRLSWKCSTFHFPGKVYSAGCCSSPSSLFHICKKIFSHLGVTHTSSPSLLVSGLLKHYIPNFLFLFRLAWKQLCVLIWMTASITFTHLDLLWQLLEINIFFYPEGIQTESSNRCLRFQQKISYLSSGDKHLHLSKIKKKSLWKNVYFEQD